MDPENGASWEWSQREAVRHRWVTRTGELAGVSESNRDIDGQPERARERARKSQLCVSVFHIDASKNETSLRPSATFPVADPANDECIYTYNGLLFGPSMKGSRWFKLPGS